MLSRVGSRSISRPNNLQTTTNPGPNQARKPHLHFSTTTQPSTENKKYVLFYDYVPQMETRRAPIRQQHLDYANNAVKKGLLIAGGAIANITGGILLFQASNEEAVKKFAEADPYVTAGLVTKWRVTEWNVVVGKVGN